MNDLRHTDIQYLKGVGEKRAQLYQKLQIATVDDLLRYYPRKYLDFTEPTPIMAAPLEQNAAVLAYYRGVYGEKTVRKGLTIYELMFSDGFTDLRVHIFNSKYTVDALQFDEAYILYGKITEPHGRKRRYEMASPLIEKADAVKSLTPVYALTKGLTNKLIGANVQQALKGVEETMADPLPDDLRQRHQLSHLHWAIENIHFPKDREALRLAKRRLIFEELFTLQLALSLIKNKNRRTTSYQFEERPLDGFYDALPFEPTGAQRKAVEQITADLCKEVPMNRLLQGDVGSGKTLVAAAAAYFCCKQGCQAALMAPTEILAEQHAATMEAFLSPHGLRIAPLTGSMTAKQKRQVREGLQMGEVDLVIGTHALLQNEVAFENLALIITDEQHRFGVEQRSAFSSKSRNPHTLVMSATPIPRTLAFTVYGDLDISVLDELPKNRQPIDTFLIDSGKRARALGFIKKHVAEGRQAFIICPLIENEEENPDSQLKSVIAYAEQLGRTHLSTLRTQFLHGKMKAAEKDAIMRAFQKGEIDVLISTTVVEVGIDVPNATVMLIENAERFGLSQLHQLRGRIGRGVHKSFCILLSDATSGQTRTRLKAMCKTSDGFQISEYDLKLRGPGDFFGLRQHGLPKLRIADMLADVRVLAEVQEETERLLASDPMLQAPAHHALREAVAELMRNTA